MLLFAAVFFGGQDARGRSIEANIFLPEAVSDISSLDRFEQEIGVKFSACKWYEDWSDSFNVAIAGAYDTHGCIPELTWQPQSDGTGVSYNDVVSGQYDSYLDSFAGAVKSFGRPVRISLAPEMNSEWVSWGIGKNGNNAENHKLFWRYVIERFRSQSVSNVEWVWTANIRYYNDPVSYGQIYPGDDYVDFAGLDGYNWGTTQGWSVWQSFSEVFARSYNEMVSVSGKDILLMEVASTEAGGDKAAWITDMFSQISNNYPRIHGLTWFSINKETDWRINSSEQSKIAFANAVNGRAVSALDPGFPTPAVETGPAQTATQAPANQTAKSNLPAKELNKKGSKEYKLTITAVYDEGQSSSVNSASPALEPAGERKVTTYKSLVSANTFGESGRIAKGSKSSWLQNLNIPGFQSQESLWRAFLIFNLVFLTILLITILFNHLFFRRIKTL